MLIITLQNVSRTDTLAAYDYHVYINELEIARGHIPEHDRSLGWIPLLQQLIDIAKTQPDQPSKLDFFAALIKGVTFKESDNDTPSP